MRCRPIFSSRTSSAPRRTRKCLEMAGRETVNRLAIAPAGRLPCRRRSSTALRVGSATAWKAFWPEYVTNWFLIYRCNHTVTHHCLSRVSEKLFLIFSGLARVFLRLNYPVMENEGLIPVFKSSDVVIEKPGDKIRDRDEHAGHPFPLEPLTDDGALQRGTLLGCLFALFVMGAAGLAVFAGVHALITGRAF